MFKDNLEKVFIHIGQLLEEGKKNSHHPFHTPSLSTLASSGFPSVRTVVLRAVDLNRGCVACHTDIRSAKVAEIQANPFVQWHFYAPEEKTQLRMTARAQIHHQDAVAEASWQATGLSSRRIYLVREAPGTTLEAPENSLPESVQNRVPTAEESQWGWTNFAVVETKIERIDWLYLAAQGHQRALFSHSENEGRFIGCWLSP